MCRHIYVPYTLVVVYYERAASLRNQEDVRWLARKFFNMVWQKIEEVGRVSDVLEGRVRL